MSKSHEFIELHEEKNEPKITYGRHIDYRELLGKYMKHVIECEGLSFTMDLPGFTGEEAEELRRIAIECGEEDDQ